MGTDRLFGTDGIRGVAGRPPLDPVTIQRVVQAVAGTGRLSRTPASHFLIARDTRESGPWIRDVVRATLTGLGVTVVDAGVLPTPAAAWLIPELGCAGGLVISASHNPAEDNGLKFLTSGGIKLSEETELEIERSVAAAAPERFADVAGPGSAAIPVMAAGDFAADAALGRRYLEQLLAPRDFSGAPADFRVVVDGANGAASPLLPELARRLPVRVELVCVSPDGRNINQDCGATSPERLSHEVLAAKAQLGLALDGDGDRIAACDALGRPLDGDALLYIFARYLDWSGRLEGRTVTGTVMTNMGLESALSRAGIRLQRVPVGDRHIQECLMRHRFTLGGEPSGHIIIRPPAITGDGLLAGLFLLEILCRTGQTPAELLAGYQPFPAKIINLPAARRVALDDLPPLRELLRLVDAPPPGSARAVVRYSGTEPLLRIMLEAERLDELLGHAAPLIEAIRRCLNP